MEIDPVCGMEVNPSEAAGTSEYNGKTYYFCAPGCKRSFDKDPEKYISKEDATERDASQIFICSIWVPTMLSMKLEDSQFPKSACGGLLKDASSYPDAMYRGEKVYFCNSACLKTFLEFPDAFMAGEIEHPKPEEFRSDIP